MYRAPAQIEMSKVRLPYMYSHKLIEIKLELEHLPETHSSRLSVPEMSLD